MIEITHHPPIHKTYAAFTNQGFLQREVGVVAERLLKGAAKEEVQREILAHNLFQLPSSKSRETLLKAVFKRLENAPDALLEHLAEGGPELRRLTNLYLVLLQHRLLREFIAEVVLEAFSRFSYLVPRTEVNAFMTHKRHQVPEVEAWSETTLEKSRSTLVHICVSAGLLQKEVSQQKTQGWRIQPQSVPSTLRRELKHAERHSFLRLLLDLEVM